eukprot:760566-Pleurochrysis_carterae.AAC.4
MLRRRVVGAADGSAPMTWLRLMPTLNQSDKLQSTALCTAKRCDPASRLKRCAPAIVGCCAVTRSTICEPHDESLISAMLFSTQLYWLTHKVVTAKLRKPQGWMSATELLLMAEFALILIPLASLRADTSAPFSPSPEPSRAPSLVGVDIPNRLWFFKFCAPLSSVVRRLRWSNYLEATEAILNGVWTIIFGRRAMGYYSAHASTHVYVVDSPSARARV